MNDDTSDRDPFEIVAEAFLASYRAGERPSIDDLAAQHPELAGPIRKLLPALVRVEQDLSIGQESAPNAAWAKPEGRPPKEQRLGDYRILREIGRGGMAVVYEAEQLSLGRRVALKVLPGHFSGDRVAFECFRREAKSAARLHHTNIVPVFEVGREGDVVYYAMQFIQGQGQWPQRKSSSPPTGPTWHWPRREAGGLTTSGIGSNASAPGKPMRRLLSGTSGSSTYTGARPSQRSSTPSFRVIHFRVGARNEPTRGNPSQITVS
jgi:hypothetical protein